MPASTFRKIFTAVLLSLLVFVQTISTVQAADLQITALIAARPEHFQLSLASNTSSSTISTGQVITFILTYGTYLASATDSIALVINWQQSPTDPYILRYIENSAVPAIQGAQPQINLAQQTITWYISPMPPGANHQVTWQMAIDPQGVAKQSIDIAITGSLTGPGVQVVPQPLRFTYVPSPLNPTPSLGTTPNPSTNPSTIPNPSLPSASITPTTDIPTPTTINPTSQPFWPTSSIGSVGWLTLLIALTLLCIMIWLIRRHFLQLLWLFYRRQTLIYGYVLSNKQPIQAIVTAISVEQPQLNAQSHTTTTDATGYYQLQLKTGNHNINVTNSQNPDQALLHQSLTIALQQRGQRLQVSFNLDQSNNATIDSSPSESPSSQSKSS